MKINKDKLTINRALLTKVKNNCEEYYGVLIILICVRVKVSLGSWCFNNSTLESILEFEIPVSTKWDQMEHLWDPLEFYPGTYPWVSEIPYSDFQFLALYSSLKENNIKCQIEMLNVNLKASVI